MGVFRAFLGVFGRFWAKTLKTPKNAQNRPKPAKSGFQTRLYTTLAPLWLTVRKKSGFVPACSHSRSLFPLKNRKNLSLIEDPGPKTRFLGVFEGPPSHPPKETFWAFLEAKNAPKLEVQRTSIPPTGSGLEDPTPLGVPLGYPFPRSRI